MSEIRIGDLFEIVENSHDHPAGHDIVMVTSVRDMPKGYVTDISQTDDSGLSGNRVVTFYRAQVRDQAGDDEFLLQWEVWEHYVERCVHRHTWVLIVRAHR